MIKRISDEVRHSLCKFVEFLVITSAVSRDKLFGSAISSDLSPFIMVTAKEKFKSILELLIFRNHLGYEMAVIVDDRHFLCIIVIKFLCCLGFEHKIVVNKAHNSPPFHNKIICKIYTSISKIHFTTFYAVCQRKLYNIWKIEFVFSFCHKKELYLLTFIQKCCIIIRNVNI